MRGRRDEGTRGRGDETFAPHKHQRTASPSAVERALRACSLTILLRLMLRQRGLTVVTRQLQLPLPGKRREAGLP